MNRINSILSRLAVYLRYFGPRVYYYGIVYPRFGGRKAILRRHIEIKRYLKKEFVSIIDKYRSVEVEVDNTSQNYSIHQIPSIIWVCWLQGEDKMPEITKKCYQSLLKYSAGRKVNFVCEKNLSNWIDIPAFIQEKVNNGAISRTHYADYIRLKLLKEYGGL